MRGHRWPGAFSSMMVMWRVGGGRVYEGKHEKVKSKKVE